ncbi:MAG TPA: hypoxanthine phosphoribosyltransferase [Actinomycetota bacterium]|nr:hypoxanthine phosphoribosyltransferase [Actinomycetota bacterium]
MNGVGEVLISEERIQQRIKEMAEQITRDYEGKDVVLVGVLKGAFMLMSDLARQIKLPLEFDFMAVSSYGSATKTSGVVRILKDLDYEITDRHVLLVEDIIDSGLTLNYLLKYLNGRKPASLEVCALLRKSGIQQAELDVRYEGFEIPAEFVIGYGLDHEQLYRNLPYIALLDPDQVS